MKSQRNKTIDFSLDEGKEYLLNCVAPEKEGVIPENCTVLGDAYLALSKIKDGTIDLLIVDPPYNLDKNFHGNGFKKRGFEDYSVYTEKWIEAVKPKLKKTASVYVCCDWKSALTIGVLMEKHFILRNRITWQREKGRGAKENWKNSMEDIFFATVSDDYTFNLDAVKQRKKVLAPYRENGKPKDWEKTENGNYRLTCPSNFWDDIAVPYWSMAENTAHPTQKPEKLIAKLILASSNANDLVLDPFAGSGTTGVVAKKLNRKYINIEQNPLYCAWGEKRLLDAETDKNIQGYEDGVFWERNSKPVKKDVDK
ncbi:MAG: site-specific DNA-methyltransferase [Clostridia bacterium]|nr:site-specific DNA-methyltransferase [Clostridia bacterium]